MSSAKNHHFGKYWLVIHTYVMYKCLWSYKDDTNNFFDSKSFIILLSLECPLLEKLLLFILWKKLFQVKGPLYFNNFVPKWILLMWGMKSNHCVKSIQIGRFSGPYFPAIREHSVWMWQNTDQKKLRIWILFKQWILSPLALYGLTNSFWIKLFLTCNGNCSLK